MFVNLFIRKSVVYFRCQTTKVYNRIIFFSFTMILAGCVSLPSPSDTALNQSMSWKQRSSQLKKINRWKLSGAIAIKAKKQKFVAHIFWQQHHIRYYKIDLFGPLAMNTIRIIGKLKKVTFYRSNQPAISAKTADSLLQDQLGWHFPVTNLYYWIRGLPCPNSSSQKIFDRYHHLIDLHQQGWIVQYKSYTQVNGYDLPNQITLKKKNLNLKIMITSWHFSVSKS